MLVRVREDASLILPAGAAGAGPEALVRMGSDGRHVTDSAGGGGARGVGTGSNGRRVADSASGGGVERRRLFFRFLSRHRRERRRRRRQAAQAQAVKDRGAGPETA